MIMMRKPKKRGDRVDIAFDSDSFWKYLADLQAGKSIEGLALAVDKQGEPTIGLALKDGFVYALDRPPQLIDRSNPQ
jgi:hypothetical protein